MRLQVVEEEEECDASRVAGWLEELKIVESEKEGEPITPPRTWVARMEKEYEEVSPTDTSFSGASIFDKEYASPCPKGRFRDDGSDATSLYDEEHEEVKCEYEPHNRLDDYATLDLAPESLNSYDPASDTHSNRDFHLQTTIANLGPPVIDTEKPRLTMILSCLQCTLASLPCSRTPPHCTRCTRNSNFQNPTCLLLRRRFPEVISTCAPSFRTLPVLLKRADETEASWIEKMVVKEKLLEIWNMREDKRNWVLPSVEIERREGWKRNSGKKEGEKGRRWEGVGRVVWWEGKLGTGNIEV